ncbi:hypothetical protein IH980_00285 [Patescibacteria group bacterium]|nr:hypothetical protein [Patescibacteria group bacterium]
MNGFDFADVGLLMFATASAIATKCFVIRGQYIRTGMDERFPLDYVNWLLVRIVPILAIGGLVILAMRSQTLTDELSGGIASIAIRLVAVILTANGLSTLIAAPLLEWAISRRASRLPKYRTVVVASFLLILTGMLFYARLIGV